MHPNPGGKGFKVVGAKQCAGAGMNRRNFWLIFDMKWVEAPAVLFVRCIFGFEGPSLCWRQRLHDSEDALLWTVCSCQRFGITLTSWNLRSIKPKNDMPEAMTVLVQPNPYIGKIEYGSAPIIYYSCSLPTKGARTTHSNQWNLFSKMLGYVGGWVLQFFGFRLEFFKMIRWKPRKKMADPRAQ